MRKELGYFPTFHTFTIVARRSRKQEKRELLVVARFRMFRYECQLRSSFVKGHLLWANCKLMTDWLFRVTTRPICENIIQLDDAFSSTSTNCWTLFYIDSNHSSSFLSSMFLFSFSFRRRELEGICLNIEKYTSSIAFNINNVLHENLRYRKLDRREVIVYVE